MRSPARYVTSPSGEPDWLLSRGSAELAEGASCGIDANPGMSQVILGRPDRLRFNPTTRTIAVRAWERTGT